MERVVLIRPHPSKAKLPIANSLSGNRSIEDNAEHLWNAIPPISSKLAGSRTSFSAPQSEKHLNPISDTESGMEMLFNPDPSKTSLSMLSNESGSSTPSKDPHL
jgi:hypothetical protein